MVEEAEEWGERELQPDPAADVPVVGVAQRRVCALWLARDTGLPAPRTGRRAMNKPLAVYFARKIGADDARHPQRHDAAARRSSTTSTS